MKKNILLIWSIFLLGCLDAKEQESNPTLKFLMSKNYKYSIDKLQIPCIVKKSLTRINHKDFKIGDYKDVGEISFSDASLGNYKYNRELHFVLVGDSICLITYSEGGIGRHDVVDFIKYRGGFKYLRYVTGETLDDTIKLRKYLNTNPQPVSSSQ